MTIQEKLAEKKAAAEVDVKELAEMMDMNTAELKAAKDAGFDEGVAQNSSPGDKIYSEADLQAELAPLKDKMVDMQAQMDSISAQLKTAEGKLVSVDADKAAAVKAKGLEVAKKIRDSQIDDLAIADELEAEQFRS